MPHGVYMTRFENNPRALVLWEVFAMAAVIIEMNQWQDARSIRFLTEWHSNALTPDCVQIISYIIFHRLVNPPHVVGCGASLKRQTTWKHSQCTISGTSCKTLKQMDITSNFTAVINHIISLAPQAKACAQPKAAAIASLIVGYLIIKCTKKVSRVTFSCFYTLQLRVANEESSIHRKTSSPRDGTRRARGNGGSKCENSVFR